jgi:hypothetical protein
MAKRNKSIDPARIGITSYDATAQVQKNSDAGLSWKPLGAVGSAVRIGKCTPVMLFNNSGTTQFVSFGTSSVAVPAGPGTGIPVLNNQPVVYNSGEHDYVIASSSSVYVYTSDPEIQ